MFVNKPMQLFSKIRFTSVFNIIGILIASVFNICEAVINKKLVHSAEVVRQMFINKTTKVFTKRR